MVEDNVLKLIICVGLFFIFNIIFQVAFGEKFNYWVFSLAYLLGGIVALSLYGSKE